MKYLCLLYADESAWPTFSKAEQDKWMGVMHDYADQLKKSGHFVQTMALQPTSSATTVRVRNNKTSATDGPYVETKEQLGGLYLIEAKDLNEAIDVASRNPAATWGAIEVRPLNEFERR